MIIKGKSRGNGAQLGSYLVTQGQNEDIRVVEISGVSAPDVPGAVREMDALTLGTGAKKGLYHAHINVPVEERLTDEQRRIAVDRLEEALGFRGQPRVVVVHEKEGREHTHVVWSRVDVRHMRVISDSFNFRAHEMAARSLEREFGHKRVQGVHIERDGQPRPERTPSQWEMSQAERTGLNPKDIKNQLTGLWRAADSGQAFAAALAEHGYVLARGDRRDFVVIDARGGIHSLSRRIDDASAQDIRERLADLDAGRLPSVREAKQIQRALRESSLAHDPLGDRRGESVRIDEEERSRRHDANDLDWTNRGGMVAQQRSAMDWVEKSYEEKRARTEQTERRGEQSEADRARQLRRQELLREFGRELSDEQAQEFDPGGERTRR